MKNKEKTIKELKEALDSLDITNKYRLNLIRAIEYLQESVSADLEEAAKRYATEGDEISGLSIIDEEVEAFKAGAKWQKGQMMTKSIDAVVSQVPCSNEIILYNPSSVYEYSLPQEMNELGLNKGDKIKVVIIKNE